MEIDKKTFKTLWYENEKGDKWYPDLGKFNPGDEPRGFVYQVSRFPCQIVETYLKNVDEEKVKNCPHPIIDREPDLDLISGYKGRKCKMCHGFQTVDEDESWPDGWEAHGSYEVASGTSSWPEDLVLAIANSGDYSLSEAILIASISCVRCLNSLYHRYGLSGGFEEFSAEWEETNTSCAFCENESIHT